MIKKINDKTSYLENNVVMNDEYRKDKKFMSI